MPSRWFLLLLFVLCVLFALAYQTQRSITLDVTEPSNEKFLDHFYPSQNGARWTESHSAVWLPALGGGNLSWQIGLTLSGPRPGRFAAPVHVVVHMNGATVGEFDARNQEEDHEWEIQPWQLGLNGDVLVEIESRSFKPSSDEREFGVRITRIWLTRTDGVALPSLRAFVLMLALMGSCVVLLRMSLAVGLGPMRATTKMQFVDPLHNPWAWILVAVWLAAVVALGSNRLQAAWWLQMLTFGFLLIAVLTWLIARVVPGPLTRRQAVRVLIVFVLAALVRIRLDLGRGYEADVATYLALAWKTVSYGIHSAYLQVNGSPPSDNPPVLLYPFWFLGWMYEQLISPLFGRTQLSYPDVLRFMLRLPSLIADLLAAALIFRVLQRIPLTFNSTLIATSAYLFNPALICDSAYWGQTQTIHTLFMLLSLIAIESRACGWAGATLAAAVLTKPQALPIAPLIFLMALRQRGLLRFTAAAAAAVLLITAPFIVAGRFGDVLGQYLRTTEFDPFIAVNAHNFWWFISGGQGWLRDTGFVGLISFRTAGLLLFAGATLLSLAVVWRDRQMLFRSAAYQSLAFFMLNTQIHENHLVPMFAPLAIAAALDRSTSWLYGAFTITALVNMALHDPNLLTWLGYSVEEMVYGTPALALARWFNAAVQMLLFIAFTVRLIMPLLAELRLRLSRVRH